MGINKIQFITNHDLAKDYFPPVPIKKLIPDWYKKLNMYQVEKDLAFDSSFIVNNKLTSIPHTSKACIPLRDYLMSGYVIRAQSDILMKQEGVNEETGVTTWSWFASDTLMLSIGGHNYEQLPIPLANKKNSYLKFNTRWAIKTPKGYSCLFSQPELFFESRFKLLPAIVDTDTYNSPISYPGFITAAETSFKIEAGTPLIAVFPFKREKWKMELSTTNKEFVTPFMTQGWYKKLFHSKKAYD